MNRSLLIRLLMVATGLIITAAALRSSEPVSSQLLLAMWVGILGGVTFFWWRERKQATAKLASVPAPAAAIDSEELLPDLDNGILSSLAASQKDGMTIFRWLKLSGWQVANPNEMYARIRELEQANYIIRTQGVYRITDSGRRRLLRDRERRQGRI